MKFFNKKVVSFSSFLLSLILIFSFSVFSYADTVIGDNGVVYTDLNPYQELVEYVHKDFLANAKSYEKYFTDERLYVLSQIESTLYRLVGYEALDSLFHLEWYWDKESCEKIWDTYSEYIISGYIADKFTKSKSKEMFANVFGYIGSDAEDYYLKIYQVAKEKDGLKEVITSADGFNAWFASQFGYSNFEKKNPNRGIVNGIADLDFDISLSSELKEVMQDVVDKEVADSEVYYCYSTDINYQATEFSNGNTFNNFKKFVIENQDKYSIFTTTSYNTSSSSYINLFCLPKSFTLKYIFSSSADKTSFLNGSDYVRITFFDSVSWALNSKPYVEPDKWEGIKGYRIDDSGVTELECNSKFPSSSGTYGNSKVSCSKMPNKSLVNHVWVTSGCVEEGVIYNDADSVKELVSGMPSFFTTSQFGQEPLNSVSASDLSGVGINYGSVSSYINNYYGENGKYPSNTDIQKYIDDILERLKNDKSNDSGINSSGNGGNGSTSSGSNVWDWLGGVGEFLGGLIGALGEAILGLLNGIKDFIYTLIADVPSIFSEFMQVFFSWLPSEITALLGLSVAAMIIYGIIKLIRG